MESRAVIGADAVVRIWERGRREHAVDRALTILAALTDRPRRELAAISVERRDIMLLDWRCRLFGPVLAGYAACPGCGWGVDVSLTAADLAEPEEHFVVEVAGVSHAVRLPTSLDLLAIAGCENIEAARRMLIRRCLQGSLADDENTAVPVADAGLDAGAEAVAVAAETELDRRAEVSAGMVELSCPDCGHGWTSELDIAAFAWREIEILAGRLLREVDVLARRYGWSEQEILGLTPSRRRFYLELAS
jgi:hypothetical protein